MLDGACRIAMIIAGALATVWACGCGVYVRAPDLRPGEPSVTVYIIDYGRHSSLLLPRSDAKMAEFAYGQWEWYALERQGVWRAPRILLLPSRATLGTRDIAPPRDVAELVRRYGLEAAYEVQVSPELSARLLRALDDQTAAASARAVYTESFDLTFVPLDGAWYWLPYNCNTALAGWLGRLDCRVSGLAILSNFSVRPARGLSRPGAAPDPPGHTPSFPPLPG